MTLLALIFAPLIVSFQACAPNADTPPYATYERWPFQWARTYSQTTNFCKDVTITFTTQSNKTYWIETGWLRTDPGAIQWRICSMPIAGTGATNVWRSGVPWSWAVFRVGQSP